MKSVLLHYRIVVFTLLALPASGLWAATPLGTAFTYPGRLNDGANPASGLYDFRFAIYEAVSGGSALASPLTNPAVTVAQGLFVTTLDFGANVFTNQARWLEIAVSTNGAGAFATLSPRQALTPSPYALYAPSAGHAPSADTFTSPLAGQVTGPQGATVVTSVGGAALQPNTVTADKIAGGQVVKSLNALRDDATLAAGANVTVTMGDPFTVEATDLQSGQFGQ